MITLLALPLAFSPSQDQCCADRPYSSLDVHSYVKSRWFLRLLNLSYPTLLLLASLERVWVFLPSLVLPRIRRTNFQVPTQPHPTVSPLETMEPKLALYANPPSSDREYALRHVCLSIDT
jgi:hypothetical protein